MEENICYEFKCYLIALLAFGLVETNGFQGSYISNLSVTVKVMKTTVPVQGSIINCY